MAGLFDFLRDNPAITQGLLAGGFGAMAGRGSKLQAWGQGGLAGLQGYGNALNNQAQEQDRALAAKRAAIQEQMLQMQLSQAQRVQQGQKATQDYLTRALTPLGGIDANAASGITGPRPEALQGVGKTPGFNVGDALKAGVPVDAIPQVQQMLSPKAADYKVVGDSLVKIGPDGVSPVFQAEPKEDLTKLIVRGPDGKPQINQLAFDVKKALAQAGASQVSFGQPIAGVDASGNPVFFQQSKGGGSPVIVPGVRPSIKADKDLTDAQAKANLFGTRASEADKILNELATKGTASPSIAQQMANPSGITGRIATAMATPQQQQADQAQRDFINAVLRRESGAVIADTEFANARLQYFPQPGDSPQVVAQKARNRKIATEGILAEVPQARRGVPAANTPAETGFSDADKERRYQEWKAKQK